MFHMFVFIEYYRFFFLPSIPLVVCVCVCAYVVRFSEDIKQAKDKRKLMFVEKKVHIKYIRTKWYRLSHNFFLLYLHIKRIYFKLRFLKIHLACFTINVFPLSAIIDVKMRYKDCTSSFLNGLLARPDKSVLTRIFD